MKNTYRKKKKEPSSPLELIYRFLQIDSSMNEVIYVRFLPQILYLAFLCLLYIGNRHYTEKKIRTISILQKQVKDLRADYTTLQADFMYESKQSEVTKRATTLGLKESKKPPILIKINEH